jgi:phosphoribosylformimino-5-aminoimidazole carboxamide ribotide isomerase
MMELLPAVDLMGGGAVRLVQGAFEQARSFGDPLDIARGFVGGGAAWLHVVDLDAARTGEPVNRPLVLSLLELAHSGGTKVEIGGGVRSSREVDALVGAGADRVVLGTAAIEDPEFAVRCARRHPGRVSVGLDYRRGPGGTLEPAVRGWTGGAVGGVGTVLGALAGEPVGAVVVTAIDRDGTLGGPDVEGLGSVLDATDLPVVAAGGVGGVGDLRRLASLRSPSLGRRLVGTVVGRALVDGTMHLEEALAACAPSV